jgi:hypothetical protein
MYSTEEYTTVKNATFEFHHKCLNFIKIRNIFTLIFNFIVLPIYKKENDVEEIQNIYTHWNSTCSAEGLFLFLKLFEFY